MAGLTKEYLIEQLIVRPVNEFEAGMNAALLLILKKIVEVNGGSGEEPLELPQTSSFRSLTQNQKELKKCMNDDAVFNKIKDVEFAELFAYLKASPSQKLEAIKYFKEITGYGLKEAKDVIDQFIMIS
jgi:hypothetical protein